MKSRPIFETLKPRRSLQNHTSLLQIQKCTITGAIFPGLKACAIDIPSTLNLTLRILVDKLKICGSALPSSGISRLVKIKNGRCWYLSMDKTLFFN